MRVKNVKISMEIPVPFGKPDENGVRYSTESFEKACENASNLPIVIMNDDGTSTVIGVAGKIRYVKDDENGDYMKVNGMLYHGGSSETIGFTNNVITSVDLQSFGITK